MENFQRRELPRSPTVAVVGATGAVGIELMGSLERRRFPLRSLRLYASPRSAGKRLSFSGEAIAVEALGAGSLAGIDIALFSAGSGTAHHFAPAAAAAGTIVIDNSSAFRMRPDVPLIVPEINGAEIAAHQGLIANPNCVAIIAAMALAPIHRVNPICRIVLASYQAASGAGAAAMAELTAATAAFLEGRDYETRVLRHPSAFNLFSHDTPIDPATGYNGEETKVMNEMRKIFAAPEMRISATCVRVPVLRAHSLAITVECARPIAPEEARVLLDGAPGVRVVDDVERNYFPMPKDASGQDAVLVGRLRRDVSDPSGRSLALFAAGDQLLKGAALNAVQIAEHLVAP
jgi:aspartate-semialdehyde dehydrogenase